MNDQDRPRADGTTTGGTGPAPPWLRLEKLARDVRQRAPEAALPVAMAATGALLLVQFLAAFVVPGRGPYGFAAWVEDDFFYYVTIARNILQLGVSTYDGVTLTNGYHPLWMVVVVALGAVFGAQTPGFFVAVFMVQAALVVAGVAAIAALMRKAEMTAGAVMAGATLYGIVGAMIAAQGMEIALLWPLLPLLLSSLLSLSRSPSLRCAIITILILAITILARLDSAIVLAPVCIAALVVIIIRIGVIPMLRLSPALLALAPLAAYLALNSLMFGAPMPISGLAKRLMIPGAVFGPSSLALGSFIEAPNATFYFAPIGVTALTIAVIVAAMFVRRLRTGAAGAGFLFVIVGVVIFYAQALFTSDWNLWRWYFYPLALTGAVAAGMLVDLATKPLAAGPSRLRPISRWLGLAVTALLALSALKVTAYQLHTPPGAANMLFLRAIPVAEFARSHPGRYAMGDGAGAVGFLLPQGPAQLEGLVNDAAMIDDLRKQGAINASLERQNVDYYIASAIPPERGCLSLREPWKGGARTPHLSQKICERPVFTNRTGWIETAIWDVRDGLD